MAAYVGEAKEGGDSTVRAAIGHRDKLLENLHSRSRIAPLYGGASGVGWLCAHLDAKYQLSDEAAYEELDECLLRTLATDDGGYYDLISGVIGVAVYFLERQTPSGRKGARLALAQLDRRASRESDGVAWFTNPDLLPEAQRRVCPSGSYNLGLAHGIPGALAVLAKIAGQKVGGDACYSLVEPAVRWLMGRRLAGSGSESQFPSWWVPGQAEGRSRLAWCYGDLSVALALLQVGGTFGRKDWTDSGMAVARQAAARSEPSSGVEDAALCHGASGVAHAFARAYQYSGDRCLKEAALRWYESTVVTVEKYPGRFGVQSWTFARPEGMAWRDDPTLLSGAAGVALALSAAVQPESPSWDRVMLLGDIGKAETESTL